MAGTTFSDLQAGRPLSTLAVAELAVEPGRPSEGITPAIATGGTIPSKSLLYRFTSAGAAITGVVVEPGLTHGQLLLLSKTDAGSVTFATDASSNVLDGLLAVLAEKRTSILVWSALDRRWLLSSAQVNAIAGQLTLSDGTVALPGLAFTLDPDTGVYRIGANNLGVAVNGAKVLDVGTGGLGVTGTLTPTDQILAASGSAGVPGIAFAAATTTGFRFGSSQLIVYVAGNQILSASSSSVTVDGTGGLLVGATDVALTRLAAGQLNIGLQGNGQKLGLKTLTELTTIAAAATTDTAIQIPAGALVLGVSVRVTTVIPTAATFNYGIAGATARYGTGIAVAATTTYPGTDDGVRFYAAATAIRITPDLTPGANTGRVRTTIHYLDLTPPTS